MAEPSTLEHPDRRCAVVLMEGEETHRCALTAGHEPDRHSTGVVEWTVEDGLVRVVRRRTDGDRPDELLEREAGSRVLTAVTLADAQSACESAFEELRYDDRTPREVLEALRIVKDWEFRL